MRAVMMLTLVLLVPLISGAAWEKDASWTEAEDDAVVWVTDKLEYDTLDDVKTVMVRSEKRIIGIELDSWGGDGDGGLALAEFISRYDGKIFIFNRCNSACSFAALVALGQGKLWVDSGAEIGVHQVYDNGTRLPNKPWTKRAAKQLRRYGAPKAPLDAMVETPPSDMVVFHESQLISMGARALDLGWEWWLFGELSHE